MPQTICPFTQKVSYKERKFAVEAAVEMRRRKGVKKSGDLRLEIFECSCGSYHMGRDWRAWRRTQAVKERMIDDEEEY